MVIIKIIKKILKALNYSIISNKLYDDSDDPMFVLSKILDPQTVKTIIDGGASIGETSMVFSKLFPNAIVHAFEPFPTLLNSLKKKSHQNLIKELKLHF